MIDLSELSPEQLVLLIAKAKQILYPEAVIVGDELECSQCHKRGVPSLVEDGMTVTHDLDTLSAERIAASLVHRFINTVSYFRDAIPEADLPSLASNSARSWRVNFHSNGRAADSQ